MANLVLKNKTPANDVILEFCRTSDTTTCADWRIVNNSGTLRMKCNYTDKAVDYYDVFTIAYNSGNAYIKGNLTIGQSTLATSTSAQTFYFPNTGGTLVTHATRGTAVGSGINPVYIASTGRATASDSTVGSSTKPVWLDAGTIKQGSTYAGGTKVTLNGSGKGGSTASFYAPTGAGTSGQLLVSSGGAPSWQNLADIADSRYVNVSGDTMTGTLKIKSGSSGNYTEGIRIAPADNGWTSLVLGSSADSGTETGAWSLHTYSNNFYLSHNGSSNGTPMFTGIPNDGFSITGNLSISGALNLANNTWNKVGDDVYFGDNNIPGAFCIKGTNGSTNLCLVSHNSTDSSRIIYDESSKCIRFVFQ